MMHHRDKLFLKWNKNRLNTHIHNAYKKFRNRTRQEIRKSKREYYNKFFETHKAQMKQLWSGIKSIITLKPRSQQLISQIRVGNIDYDDPKDIANQFNKFSINVAGVVRKTIPSAPKSHTEYLKAPNPQSIFLYPCTPKAIEDIINFFNPTKVCGPYSIPIKLLKMLSKQISILLSDLINSSLTTGTTPTKFKVSKVNPLHKKGSNIDPNNYISISLLLVFSKIYEKMMYARLYKFLENSVILFKAIWFQEQSFYKPCIN